MTSSRLALAVGAILAVGALVIAVVLLRPTATATTIGGLTVECLGLGDEPACAEWADTVMADGPGIHTFEPDDLERVRLGRSVFGHMGECQAEYFVGRFGSEAVARETVPCPRD